MKTTILFILISIMFSCNNKNNCDLPLQVIGSGEIISNGLVSNPLTTFEMKSHTHIINDTSQNIFNLKVSFDGGLNYVPIDFSQYTLLGIYTREDCQVRFERNVYKDITNKKYDFTIKVIQCGKCETNAESMNWVLINKMPSDFSVFFRIEFIDI